MLCYQITNQVNGKVYVGLTTKTLAERWLKHVSTAKKSETPLGRAIRKYGAENFVVEELASALGGRKVLAQLEKDLIKQHNCIAPKGYNATSGGDGVGGCAETSKKISASLTGKKLTKEHKENLRKGAINRKSSPCTKEKALKISLAQKGKPRAKHTEETKEKCRVAGKKVKFTAEHKAKLSANKKAFYAAKREAQTLINSVSLDTNIGV